MSSDFAIDDRRRRPDGPAPPSVHLLVIEPDRQAAGLIDEMVRHSWRGSLSLTHASRVEDVSHPLAAAATVILLGGEEPRASLEHVRVLAPGVPVVVLSPEYEAAAAHSALRAGAQDFLATGTITARSLRRALDHAIERKRSEDQLASRALQDPLTGLPNRTLFLDRLGIALERTRRTGAVTGVMFLDVDDFKVINDTMGHDAGDRVLVTLADRLRTVLRPMDTVARFGGDEFTFLFEDLASPSQALAIAERVREVVGTPIELVEGLHELAVSIGIATTSDATVSPEAIIQEADAAMFEAKRRGGDAALATSAGGEQAAGEHGAAEQPAPQPSAVPHRPHTRELLAEDLPHALDGAELFVLYQPHFLLGEDHQVLGFEALVRWQHPDYGLIAPAEFIPIADEIGMTPPIGQFVLGEALPLLARLREAQSDLSVSVNVSASQLADEQLAATLAAVDASGVDPAAVCLDIRENILSEEPEMVGRAALALKAAGIRVAIDDYGTGSAPLHSLRSLRADQLKIDPRLVEELDGPARDGSMVAAVVELGHALGMTVTAEGVESEAQLLELRLLGCDAAQGFALSRPLAADQLEELILNGHH